MVLSAVALAGPEVPAAHGQVPRAFSFVTAPGSPFAVTPFSGAVTVADFNGDHHDDLAVAGYGAGDLSVFLGDGSGALAAASGSPVQVSGHPERLLTGDFNGDGHTDLLTISPQTGDVMELIGAGDGEFAPASRVPVWACGSAAAVGDFNGDGRQDLAIADGCSRGLRVLLADVTGRLVPAPGSPLATGWVGNVTAADFNGDRRPDLAVVTSDKSKVSVLVGVGGGRFTVAKGPKAPAGQIAVADFNGDGRPDLAVDPTRCESSHGCGLDLRVWLGDGRGGFHSPRGARTVIGRSGGFVTGGDFNGDGHQDVVVSPSSVEAAGTVLLLGDGSGRLFARQDVLTEGPPLVGVGDFNGDGRSDLAVVKTVSGDAFSRNGIAILLNVPGAPVAPKLAVTSGCVPGAPVEATVTAEQVARVDFAVDGAMTTRLTQPNAWQRDYRLSIPTSTLTVGRHAITAKVGFLTGDPTFVLSTHVRRCRTSRSALAGSGWLAPVRLDHATGPPQNSEGSVLSPLGQLTAGGLSAIAWTAPARAARTATATVAVGSPSGHFSGRRVLGTTAVAPSAAIAPDGHALAVWADARGRLMLTARPPGGRFGTPRAISAVGTNVRANFVRVLLGAHGGYLVWENPGPAGGTDALAAPISQRGRLGSVRHLGQGFLARPEPLAIDSRGDAVIVWGSLGSPDVWAARAVAGGAIGAPELIAPGGFDPSLAMATDGRTAITYRRYDEQFSADLHPSPVPHVIVAPSARAAFGPPMTVPTLGSTSATAAAPLATGKLLTISLDATGPAGTHSAPVQSAVLSTTGEPPPAVAALSSATVDDPRLAPLDHDRALLAWATDRWGAFIAGPDGQLTPTPAPAGTVVAGVQGSGSDEKLPGGRELLSAGNRVLAIWQSARGTVASLGRFPVSPPKR
jgi:hypothetical protein